nr:hypothetical protein [Aquicoccus sp. G2-2]MEA1115017.1 hypothetical protein [Aquicoccus sp. G2-2]
MRTRVDEVLQEVDPKRRLALSRKLRAEIGGLLSEEDNEKLRQTEIGRSGFRWLREIDKPKEQ